MASEVKIRKPLDWAILTQPFGVNYVDFYQKLGLKGHNGMDFRCYENTVYACFDGWVKYAGRYSDGGIGIEMVSNQKDSGSYLKVIYYHLKVHSVKTGDKLIGGQPIGISDNTGKYTTGDHLHLGLKRCDYKGNTLNYNNGYHGAIDPTSFLIKGFYHLPVDKRYGKPRNWFAEWKLRFKNPWVHRQLKKNRRHPLSLTSAEVNAIIYGAWDFSIAVNPSMRPIISFLTKSQYRDGKRPPKGFPLSI